MTICAGFGRALRIAKSAATLDEYRPSATRAGLHRSRDAFAEVELGTLLIERRVVTGTTPTALPRRVDVQAPRANTS